MRRGAPRNSASSGAFHGRTDPAARAPVVAVARCAPAARWLTRWRRRLLGEDAAAPSVGGGTASAGNVTMGAGSPRARSAACQQRHGGGVGDVADLLAELAQGAAERGGRRAARRSRAGPAHGEAGGDQHAARAEQRPGRRGGAPADEEARRCRGGRGPARGDDRSRRSALSSLSSRRGAGAERGRRARRPRRASAAGRRRERVMRASARRRPLLVEDDEQAGLVEQDQAVLQVAVLVVGDGVGDSPPWTTVFCRRSAAWARG